MIRTSFYFQVNAAVIMNQQIMSRIAKPYPLLVKKKIEKAIRACAERSNYFLDMIYTSAKMIFYYTKQN